MHKEAAGYAVAVYPDGSVRVFLSVAYYPQYQGEEECKQDNRAHKSPLFANGAEDKVGTLFRDKFEFGLGPLKVPFACKTSGADGNFGLMDIISCPFEVLGYPQKVLYPVPVVLFEHFVEDYLY